ncbi:TIGR01440 family protein [Planomicrobium sp. CPCC 101079]|uniref:TIGR01440 family protein n=1 Tax=Planomicrobium sp. CPCC 101079 TaxID=2599618 RepID=UPI0011B3B6C2|nr:TIGR01440 family protein [Planomicrobium sp. CPCC 101079]TWT03522.1 TIGR01440 family protein [Planomicrobium sp. CPCC 101079]
MQTLWQLQLEEILSELEQQIQFRKGQVFVIGCSTSEIAGKRIGTGGGLDIAESLFEPFEKFAARHKIHLAFQGCEHINRALTVERQTAEKYGWEPVSVIPVAKAGGSMSAYAFMNMKDPVVVEEVQAHAGIDIGQTMIGMHLKRVAVPVRTSVKLIGDAIISAATTRPKLIGGERARYTRELVQLQEGYTDGID